MKNEAPPIQQITQLIPLTRLEFQQKILRQIRDELAKQDALGEFSKEYPPDDSL